MLKKFTNKKGFTLMEMLIVVAIIAVLVAIAIPTFNGALTKAKESADVANVRALYAEWQLAMLTDNKELPTGDNAKETFLAGPTTGGNTYTFNDPSKITYTPDTTNGKSKGTLEYDSDKLTGGNVADDSSKYEWKLENPSIT